MSEAPETSKRDEPSTESVAGTAAPPQAAGWRRHVSPALVIAVAAFLVVAWQWGQA